VEFGCRFPTTETDQSDDMNPDQDDLDEGYDSLDMDPYLRRPAEDEEDGDDALLQPLTD
jgi:hypothetical protein